MPLTPYGINCQLVPTGAGWWYPQPFQGATQRIPATGCAGDAKTLCREVLRFRVAQGIPIGDYRGDIAAHISAISPLNRFNRRKQVTAPPRTFEEKVPLFTRITRWLAEVAAKGPRTIGAEEIEARVKVCAECPKNRPLKGLGTLTHAEITFRCACIRQRPVSDHDARLGSCGNLYLPTAVFLDRDYLPTPDPQAPENCWLPKKP